MSEGSKSSATTEAMTIYIDKSGNLKCAPFGLTASKSTRLTYSGVKPFNTDKWQHVSCSYQQKKLVSGQYVALDLNQSRDVRKDLLARFYSRSLAWNDDRVMNYIARTKWEVTLGNNWDKSKF